MKNTCYLSICTGKDTAEFVGDNIDYHWNMSIKEQYPNAKKMLILCDGSGSNSSSHYVVKEQFKLPAERLQMEIIVVSTLLFKMESDRTPCFQFISKKWQEAVFDNYDIIKDPAEQTTTKTGFTVKAFINSKKYEPGRKASDKFMEKIPVTFNDFRPKMNAGNATGSNADLLKISAGKLSKN